MYNYISIVFEFRLAGNATHSSIIGSHSDDKLESVSKNVASVYSYIALHIAFEEKACNIQTCKLTFFILMM